MKQQTRIYQLGLRAIGLMMLVGHLEISDAQSIETNPYMGGAVELAKAPNGAIANKKLLDRVGDFN